MKIYKIIVIAIIVSVTLIISSNTGTIGETVIKEDIDIPENVKTVLDNKCFGCHNVEATSDKAKDKLLLDQLDKLSKSKLVMTMGGIEEVIKEDKMPPAKFLEKKPEQKLTEDERDLIKDWAVSTADKLIN